MRVGWISHFWLLKNTHFVLLGAITTTLVNNEIKIFLIKTKIILCYFQSLSIGEY